MSRGGIVSLNGEGVITDVGTCGNPDSIAGVEFYAGILIPGMVNAHSHLELSYMHGAIPPGGGFIEFARGMGSKRHGTPHEDRVRAAAYWDAKMYSEGISAVGDICNDYSTFKLKAQSPIVYHNFAELFGLGMTDAVSMELLAREGRETGLQCTVTPHATYSLNDAAFRAAVGGSGNTPLSVHFMESRAEEELYRKKGDFWNWYAKSGATLDFLHYGSPARRIAECVPADRDVTLIHNTFIREEDIALLKGHFGDRLTFVLCPRSNAYIEGAYPPADMLRRASVRIAVGTDSLASNDSLSMIEELKMFTGVPLEELLCWATANGARALGMDAASGTIEVGKQPGLAILTGVDYDTMTLTARASVRRIV